MRPSQSLKVGLRSKKSKKEFVMIKRNAPKPNDTIWNSTYQIDFMPKENKTMPLQKALNN